jgi:hypothetical protein
LFATQIADEGRDLVEVGVAQEIRDVLEPCCSIMDVVCCLGKMLLEVAGRMMAGRRQAADSQGGRLPLLCGGFVRLSCR